MASPHAPGVTLNIALNFKQEVRVMMKVWGYRKVELNGDGVTSNWRD